MKAGKSKAVRVGDKVTFHVGAQRLRGRVIEDRGHIGVSGRQLLRIRVASESDVREFELPAEDVARSA